jgi:hypothetical protein
MKKYKLLPSMSVPKAIANILAYLVLGFGLLILVTGIIVKDEQPAAAQDTKPDVVISEVEASPSAASDDSDVTAAASRAVAQAIAAGLGELPKSDTSNSDQTAAAAAPPSQAVTAPSTDATPSVATKQDASPETYFRDRAIAKGQTEALIDIKKAEDTTSIFGRIMSIVGIFAFLGISWLLSNNRKKILWKLVAVGTLLQLGFAMFILWTPVGKLIFAGLNNAITVLLDFTKAGSEFLFASYASGTIESANVHTAMSILPPIIFSAPS